MVVVMVGGEAAGAPAGEVRGHSAKGRGRTVGHVLQHRRHLKVHKQEDGQQ